MRLLWQAEGALKRSLSGGECSSDPCDYCRGRATCARQECDVRVSREAEEVLSTYADRGRAPMNERLDIYILCTKCTVQLVHTDCEPFVGGLAVLFGQRLPGWSRRCGDVKEGPS